MSSTVVLGGMGALVVEVENRSVMMELVGWVLGMACGAGRGSGPSAHAGRVAVEEGRP